MTVTDAPAPATESAAVDHVAALRKAGQAYARKQKAADTAREALVVVIRTASAAGVTKTEIAATADVARETVYKALRGAPTDATAATVDTDALETGDRVTA